MNVVIKAGTDKSFLINDVPYQRGAYEVVVESNNGFISIVRAGAGTIITKTSLENVRGGSGQSFATFEDFVNYIEPFFFRNVIGGGGGVTSVFGRDGIVECENGDYNAGQITETATAKIMTDAERTKLAGINPQASNKFVDIGNVRIQWGVRASGLGNRTVTLPAPFANTNYTVTANTDSATSDPPQLSRVILVGGKTTTSFKGRAVKGTDDGDSDFQFQWIAIGQKP